MTGVQNGTERTGHWVTPPVSYVEPLRLSCALCGRPIARKHWREFVEGSERIFCEPGHAELYESYWVPRYGEAVGSG